MSVVGGLELCFDNLFEFGVVDLRKVFFDYIKVYRFTGFFFVGTGLFCIGRYYGFV